MIHIPLMNHRQFLQAKTTAPALTRGLAVLVMLDGQAPQSLETLSKRLGLPKASVFRLLDSLREIGLVRKRPDKLYEALCLLRPLADTAGAYRERVEKRMANLCAETACTVEWYEPAPQGMKLVHQVNPENELRVQAKPGFLRAWGEEFDAVARLGHAFAEIAPRPASFKTYHSNGVIGSLSARDARKIVAEDREAGSAADRHFNSNSVRRIAMAAIENGEFRGVLALAEAYRFSAPSRPAEYLGQLRQTLENL